MRYSGNAINLQTLPLSFNVYIKISKFSHRRFQFIFSNPMYLKNTLLNPSHLPQLCSWLSKTSEGSQSLAERSGVIYIAQKEKIYQIPLPTGDRTYLPSREYRSPFEYHSCISGVVVRGSRGYGVFAWWEDNGFGNRKVSLGAG